MWSWAAFSARHINVLARSSFLCLVLPKRNKARQRFFYLFFCLYLRNGCFSPFKNRWFISTQHIVHGFSHSEHFMTLHKLINIYGITAFEEQHRDTVSSTIC